MTELRTTTVDLRGLMRVMGQALYSTPHVALRELVQNAHDACVRRRLEDTGNVVPAGITVRTSAEAATITITDTGAGLTRDEIDTCLATVGTGYTGRLRDTLGADADGSDALIGMFGLGFLSSYVISERTEVWTCSYQTPNEAWRFMSRNGEAYTVEEAAARPVGTSVTLHLRAGHKGLTDVDTLAARLRHYAGLLHVPITLDGHGAITTTPPWRDTDDVSPIEARRRALEFAADFEPAFEPLCTFDVDDGKGLRGVLWLQDGASYGTADQRRVSVFVRGMLVSDDERELLPRWAGFVGVAIESALLRPTASREALQEDDAFHHAQAWLKETLIAGLAKAARHDPPTWRRILARHNEALVGAALADARLWELLKDDLTVPTTEGDRTLADVLLRSDGHFYVSQSDSPGVEAILLRALRRPVVHGTRFGALALCNKSAANGRGTVVVLGTSSGDQALFSDADVGADEKAALLHLFARSDCDVQLKRFAPAVLPFVVVRDREVELKRRLESDAADKRMGQAVLSLARRFTGTIANTAPKKLYVNVDSPLVQALVQASDAQRQMVMTLLAPLEALLAADTGDAAIEPALQLFSSTVTSLLSQKVG
jgi:molecular chaperone HtpG